MRGPMVFLSPRLLPLLMACGVIAYGAVAGASNEPLATLLALVRHSPLLQVVLWLLPLGQAARSLYLLRCWQARRRELADATVPKDDAGATTVTLAGLLPATAAERLAQQGYRVRRGKNGIVAWRGASALPPRALGCLAVALVSGGLIVSITGREVRRVPLVAGEPLPRFLALPGAVRAIDLRETPAGTLFSRRLTLRISRPDGGEREIGMFPPSRIGGWWYYPRYLGAAPLFAFSASDPPASQEDYHLLTLYPPGVEDTATIPGTPYRVTARLEGDAVSNTAGGLHLLIKKGDELLGSGALTVGGELAFRGGRLRMPDLRPMVTVDFVRDGGLPSIWLGLSLGILALTGWGVVRICLPRCEILLYQDEGTVTAFSRAEGRKRRHDELFHGLLDQIGPAGRDGAVPRRQEDA